jgi:predicted GH43/DUF377 family glycosyl hydrolase
MLKKYKENPILKPRRQHKWESKRVFNCAAVYESGRVHIVYRAQGEDGISRLGYASSSDGYTVDERLDSPIFSPSEHFEKLGCEDPRITRIGDNYIIFYTAYGETRGRRRACSKDKLPQVGMTTISVNDFLNHRWKWGRRIYPFPLVESKNCVLFPEKFDGKYVIYHRIPPHIWVAYSRSLDDWSESNHRIVMQPRERWESIKIGAGAPPIRTGKGWLFVYHGVDDAFTYRLGLAFIDLNDPQKVSRSGKPILQPKEEYEQNIVFTCGAVTLDGKIFVYYGCDDTVIGVATCDESQLLSLFEGK